MERITETLESIHITSDTKARRVLNTAPDKMAGITLDEIQRGVTIERLETLKVPVYQYGTQITIHGTFEDMPRDLRVCGFKSVFLNGNGSLGIKYIAIDGAKKELLYDVARLGADDMWNVAKDSQGYEAYKIFHSTDSANDKKRTLECYNSTPDNLFIGGKRAAALLYGGYAVILNIGAIYESNVWPLIKALTGIGSQAEADKIEADKAAQRAADHAAWDAEHKIKEAIAAKAKAEYMAIVEPLYTWVNNPESGAVCALQFDYEGKPEYIKVEFKKRGTQLMSRRAFRRDTFEAAIESTSCDSFHITKRTPGKNHKYIVSKKKIAINV